MWCAFPILASRQPRIDYSALKYNHDLPWVMSFLLVPHLPRLIRLDRRTAVADKQTLKKFIYGCVICTCLKLFRCVCLLGMIGMCVPILYGWYV